MLKSFLAVLVMAGMALTPAQERFSKRLTGASQTSRVETWQITHRDLNLQTKAEWSVRKETLHGGKQEGAEIIVVNNGKLSFTVIPTRGMGILAAEMNGVRLGWDSPVKEVVHPQFINLHSRGGLGWLEGFNEWMVRCGLEFAGHPGKDRFINNVGDEAEMDLTLHGKIANIPASEVEVLVDRDPPYRIRVRGRVDEKMFYGPKLELWTEVSTEPGSDSFRIEDTVTNRGAFEQEFQLIYHSNYGPPLLEKGARFIGAVRQVAPFNNHAAKAIDKYDEYAAPAKGFIEQVYCIYPFADESNRTTIALQNAKGDKAVSLSFSTEEMPYVTLWKNTTALEEGYVTGLEPGTGFPYNRRVERRFNRVPKLAAGQTRHFAIDFRIHMGVQEVERVIRQIARIQGDRKTTVIPEPARIE